MAQEFLSVFFEIDSHNCSPAQSVSLWIWLYLIWGSSLWSPNPLSIIIVGFRNHNDFRPSQESWIESDTKLSNKVDVPSLKSFKEVSSTRLSNGTKILNKLLFSHPNTGIPHLNILFILINLNPNLKILSLTQGIWVSKRYEPNLIKRIRGIRYDLSEEDFFLGIQWVDQNIHESIIKQTNTWWPQWWTKRFMGLFIDRLCCSWGTVSWKWSRTVGFSSFVFRIFIKLITRIIKLNPNLESFYFFYFFVNPISLTYHLQSNKLHQIHSLTINY